MTENHTEGDSHATPAETQETKPAAALPSTEAAPVDNTPVSSTTQSDPAGDAPVATKTPAKKRSRTNETLFNMAAIEFDSDSDHADQKPAEGYSRYGSRRRTQTLRLDDELAAARAAEQTAAKQRKQAAAKAKN